MGPVQVLVVAFDRPTFSGEVLAELTRLGDEGVVRLVDLLLVERAEDGSLHTIDPPDGMDPATGRLAAALLGSGDDVSSSPASGDSAGAWSLDDTVPAGAVSAVALLEHVWAEPLRAAIDRAGGRPVDETWLAPDDLSALEALLNR